MIRIGVLVAETGGMVGLAPDLRGPVGLQLARAVERPPGEHGMPGDSRYELKWDGFRVGAVCAAGAVRLWSRNGKDFTAKFPDVQARWRPRSTWSVFSMALSEVFGGPCNTSTTCR